MTVKKWESYINSIRKEGSSVGAIIEINVTGIDVGLGEPIFDKVDALLAYGIMSIPAVKGVEIGVGFASAELRGEENSDQILSKKKNFFSIEQRWRNSRRNNFRSRFGYKICCETNEFNLD